jgi:hypothetical protein
MPSIHTLRIHIDWNCGPFEDKVSHVLCPAAADALTTSHDMLTLLLPYIVQSVLQFDFASSDWDIDCAGNTITLKHFLRPSINQNDLLAFQKLLQFPTVYLGKFNLEMRRRRVPNRILVPDVAKWKYKSNTAQAQVRRSLSDLSRE